jgi:N-acetylglucosaminyl-diphospho-decaprenol L-rhamnosyltransferase
MTAATSVVIVNYRTADLTCAAVASALDEPETGEVVVVDNASGDGSADHIRATFAGEPRVRVVDSDRNRGFGAGVNLALAGCRLPLVLILNSDATLVAGSLGRLAATLAADDAVGLVAPAVYLSDGRTLQPGTYGRLPERRDIVSSGGWVSTRTEGSAGADELTPGWVSGVAMLVRRADLLAVGGFDESFTMYLEDVDLCRRLAMAGKSVRREPAAAVVHHGGKSWRSPREQVRRFHQSKLRYFEKLGVTPAERWCIRVVGVIRAATTPR